METLMAFGTTTGSPSEHSASLKLFCPSSKLPKTLSSQNFVTSPSTADSMQIVIQATWQFLAGVLFLSAATWLWEVFFSPLRVFPGPGLAKVTNFWRAIATASYKVETTHRELHRKYGSAVRIGPSCISISDPSLIKTIYSTKNPWSKVEHTSAMISSLLSVAE